MFIKIHKWNFRLAALLAVIVILFILQKQDNHHASTTQSAIVSLLENVYQEQKGIFTHFLESQHRHLKFLLATPPVAGIDRAITNDGVDPLESTTTALWEARLASIFSSLVESYQDITQVRLIDASSGNELVRVNQVDGKSQRVINSQLQNKSSREYVKRALLLAEGEVYTSQLDLNREHQVIEYPLNPTIRFAMPVYNEDHRLYALLVINVSAAKLLAHLRAVSNKHNVAFTLLDQYDNIIEHTDDSYRFTKDLAPEIKWHEAFETIPWTSNGLKITKKHDDDINYITLIDELVITSLENHGASSFTFINYISEDMYDSILLDKRLSSLGYLIIIFIIFSVISVILIFYFRSSTQLRKTRTQFAAIIEGASDGIIAINNKLQIESVNQAAIHFFPELENVKSEKNITDLNSFSAELLVPFLKEPHSENLRLQVKSSDNSADLCVKASPILDDKNHKIGNAFFIQDISEQLKYERGINELNTSLEDQILVRTAELEKARKNAIKASNIKSQFVSTISHEMRTPLNGILGSLSVMAKQKHDEHITSLLDMMNSSAASLSTLINDVLDLSKIEAGKLEIVKDDCNVIAVIEDTVIALSAQASNKKIDIELDLHEIKYFSLHLDSGRLVQILNNLIGNALKFTIAGGVYITARTRLIDDQVRLEVSIRDTGIGIAKELQSKLFQSFGQADNSIASEFGGTGLGLSISKQLCELMGGKISVVSEKGEGSTFSFYIETIASSAKALPEMNLLNKKTFKLLLLDEFIVQKWENIIRYLGGSLVAGEPDYYIVDCHHVEYQSMKNDDEKLAKCIFLSRHSDSYAEMHHGFAFLNRPTKLISLIRLFSNNPKHLQYFTSSRKEDDKSELDFPNLADKTYLVVDDNNINITIACHLLHSVNAKTITATSGVAAIEKLIESQNEHIHIDAILLDCQMPIMDGYEATKRIRNGEAGDEFITTPIIALTANAMSDEREKCLALGMNEYLTKPIDTIKLFNTLNNFLTVDNHIEPDVEEIELHVSDSLNQSEALNRLDGNEILYQKLLLMFLDETPNKLMLLNSCFNLEDYEGMRQVCHALKGTCGNISALSLFRLAAELETKVQQETPTDLHLLLNAIELEYQQLDKIIATILKLKR
ncbi:ATP-binding protein [Thalassotalea piscium]